MSEVAKDAYQGLKSKLFGRYPVVEAEVLSVESEPEEPLRQQLLAKQLDKAGAGDDAELLAAAQTMLNTAADHAPEAAAAVGFRLDRVTAGGNVEISNIDLQGAGGVSVADVAAGGDFKLTGVKVQASEPPHPTQAR
ncbi:hypothetical protein AB0I35_32215 [Nocardia sp. NPDC050378]|uniref:hypothetical protein n=1 Tax=Nocardia sp. NPDC050378 TaxID=3155400 RepID=UPI0034097C62